MALFSLYLVACALLVLAGISKLVRPLDTARAIERLVPLDRARALAAARALGVVETLLGTAAALAPYRTLAVCVAGAYLVFAAFLLYVRARDGSLATCGCISAIQAPATRTHVVFDLALAAAGATVAANGSQEALWQVLAHQPMDGVPLVAASVCCVWLVVLTLSASARLADARRMVEETSAAG